MKTEVTAVFDIGRTNKKFFLFDSKFQEVYREYVQFEDVVDEDGFSAENINSLKTWVKAVFEKMLNSNVFKIVKLNFSCYGASWVHIDDNGEVLTPLYNYMKPFNEDLSKTFFDIYKPQNELMRITGSPQLGMLNSGLQLYWLKYKKPEIFNKIRYSLHLPQYLSYLFTGLATSDYTSIGCHTMLWDYEKKDYHSWVYKEGIAEKLAPITTSENTTRVKYNGRDIQVGAGLHDSSSALIPYFRSVSDSFLLVSTGTWSISINPFSCEMLTSQEIQDNVMFNMRVNGSPVKVSRLFLGYEYKLQIEKISKWHNKDIDFHKSVKFNQAIVDEIKRDFKYMFRWESLYSEDMPDKTLLEYENFEYTYHQMMIELVLLQTKCIKAAIGKTEVRGIYVDGGFSNNEVFIKLLSQSLAEKSIYTTDSSLGSALGAAMEISDVTIDPDFLIQNYSLKRT